MLRYLPVALNGVFLRMPVYRYVFKTVSLLLMFKLSHYSWLAVLVLIFEVSNYMRLTKSLRYIQKILVGIVIGL